VNREIDVFPNTVSQDYLKRFTREGLNLAENPGAAFYYPLIKKCKEK